MSEQRHRPDSTPSGEASGPKGQRLDSWKEIAAYLGRNTRTIQLWEENEALPVHRHFHSGRASVYAYTAELDDWRKSRESRTRMSTDEKRQLPEVQRVVPQARVRRIVILRVVVSVLITSALATMGIIGWRTIRRRRRFGSRPVVLAVLPFESLSSEPDDSYLADGLTDDLITDLGRTGQLRVISRTSVMQFKGKHEPLKEIAQSLHADWIVEGTLVRNGTQSRITAQLIDAASDSHLWAGSYEHDYRNILSLQDDVAGDVALAVLERVRGGKAVPGSQAAPVVPQARVAYLKGRFYWDARNEAGLKHAINEFNQAIGAAPSYAPAYAGLADSYNLLSVWGALAPREAFPLAKQAALKALELDPSSAEAHTSLAFETYRYEWDFGKADDEFQRAIALNPNYVTAHQWYGEFLGDLTRFDQAVAELRRAQELDPLSPIVGSDLAAALVHARRTQEAIAELQDVLQFHPDFAPAHLYLSTAYRMAGNPAAHRQELLLYSKLSGDQGPIETLQLQDDVASGRQQAARELYDRIAWHIREGRSGNFQMAVLEVSVGRNDRAFEWLDKAYREHSWWLVTLLVEPGLDPIRNDPRFRALVQRVGIPH